MGGYAYSEIAQCGAAACQTQALSRMGNDHLVLPNQCLAK
jgi:hypothetical protein